MRALALGLGIPLRTAQGLRPPAGYVFLTDDDGKLLVEDDGAYLIEPA